MKKNAGTIAIIVTAILLILALAGGIFYICYIDSITITNGKNGKLVVEIGDSDLLHVEFPDKIYVSTKTNFESSNTDVVTVDSNGKFKAKGVGTAKITATTVLFNRQATINVIVNYGEPDKIEVETISGKEQYVGSSVNDLETVTFKATTTRNGEPSQDPELVSFRWQVFDAKNIQLHSVDSVSNILSFTYNKNEYQKIYAKCFLVYNGEVKTSVFDTDTAIVYERIKKEDISYRTYVGNDVDELTNPIEMGNYVSFILSNNNAKTNPNIKPEWSYSVNSESVNTGVKDYNVKLLVDKKGLYNVTATFNEEGAIEPVTIVFSFESKYQQVTSVGLDRDVVKQSPERLKPFTIKVSWNKYADINQVVTLCVVGVNMYGEEGYKELTINATNGQIISVNPKKVTGSDYVEIEINEQSTGVYLDLSAIGSTPPVAGIYAKIGTIKSNTFKYEISESDVENVRIVASTDGVFDQSESISIVSNNNYGKTNIKVGAKTYPQNSYASVDWYVNGIKQTVGSNVITLPQLQSKGEYFIYCVVPTSKLKSNTIVIPSTSYNIDDYTDYLGEYNGQNVNRLITSQSDMDSFLEYCILNEEKTPLMRIDTSLQSDLKKAEQAAQLETGNPISVYNGERFWIAKASGIFDKEVNYYYVNDDASFAEQVIGNIDKNGNETGLLSRTFFRVGYSGNFDVSNVIQKGHLNKALNSGGTDDLKFEILPTAAPSRVSGQRPYQPIGKRPYSPIAEVNRRSKLPIDEVQETAKNIETSSQLYDAVENGYRPEFVTYSGIDAGKISIAEQIYNEARKMLTTYISDDMTDLQKVRIIHDWICYEVTYDRSAADDRSFDGDTKTGVNRSLEYSAFYLEGVFSLEGTIYSNQIAVCDGKSKAFVLLCAMEGIKSIRVTGVCYADKAHTINKGGHAWNKVYLSVNSTSEPAWYVVDTTWDDTDSYKGILDTYFLVSDKKHNEKHIDSYGNTIGEYYCTEDGIVGGYPPANSEYVAA